MNQATFRAVDPERSRIVLIGTPHHRDESLPDVPVVANNVASLAAVFTDPELGGFPAEHCVIVPPEADLAQVGEVMTAATRQATDSLLVYYSGHGLLDRRGGLYLCLAGTRLDQLAYSALPFDTVRESIQDSAAVNRVLILDSCYSGRAIGQHLSADEQTVLAAVEVSGSFTLTSAPANRVALVLDGERHTAFTERLLRLLRGGSPQAAQMLTLADIYQHLHAQLTAESLPVPQRRGTNTADLLGLVRNRRRVAARQLLTAGPIAALVHVATSEGRATVQPVWQDLPRRRPAAQMELVVIAGDSRSGRHFRSRSSRRDRRRHHRGLRLCQCPGGDRGDRRHKDPERAVRLLAGEHDAWAKVPVASALALIDPDRAQILAASIADLEPHSEALFGVAEAVAHSDPERALGIARRIKRPQQRAEVLTAVARAVAATDADRALGIISLIDEHKHVLAARADVAPVIAATDPDRAMRIARDITEESGIRRLHALVGVASVLLGTRQRRSSAIRMSFYGR